MSGQPSNSAMQRQMDLDKVQYIRTNFTHVRIRIWCDNSYGHTFSYDSSFSVDMGWLERGHRSNLSQRTRPNTITIHGLVYVSQYDIMYHLIARQERKE